MEEMNELNLLAAVKRVEPPIHLKRQLDARVSKVEADSLPNTWIWMAAASVALLITVNTFMFRNEYFEGRSSQSTNEFTSAMGIQTSNQLY